MYCVFFFSIVFLFCVLYFDMGFQFSIVSASATRSLKDAHVRFVMPTCVSAGNKAFIENYC
jgi:hypothetical protein